MLQGGCTLLLNFSGMSSKLEYRSTEEVIQFHFHTQRVRDIEGPCNRHPRLCLNIEQRLPSTPLQLVAGGFGLESCNSLAVITPPQGLSDWTLSLGGDWP